MKQLSTRSLAFVCVFAALHVILYLISPPVLWRNWAIYLAPIEGIILGPWAGFLAALIGSTIGRIVLPNPLWMFGIIAEPMSVLTAGFLVRRTWKPVVAIYAAMFLAYFASPLGRALPVWPLSDAVIAFCLVYPAAKLSKNLFGENLKLLPVSLAIVSFITVATDGMARVFLLVPARLYSVLFMTQDAVLTAFVGGGINSFIEDALVIFVSLVVGVPIVLTLRKVLSLQKPLS
jgi:uncharacterized membrane protein